MFILRWTGDFGGFFVSVVNHKDFSVPYKRRQVCFESSPSPGLLEYFPFQRSPELFVIFQQTMLYLVIGDPGNYLSRPVIVFGTHPVWDSNFSCNGYTFPVNCLWPEGESWFLHKIVWYFKGHSKGKLKSRIRSVSSHCETMNVLTSHTDC